MTKSINEQVLELIFESKKHDQEDFKTNICIPIAHMLKTVVQPEKFTSSWARTINRINKVLNKIPDSYNKQKERMTISDFSNDIIESANKDMDGNNYATEEDLKKIINFFGNRLFNLQDKDRRKAFLKNQIMKSNMQDVYKKENIKIIDNEEE